LGSTLVVLGPYAVNTYDVVTVLSDGGCDRVNVLRMTHARIAAKATACVDAGESQAWLTRVIATASEPAVPNAKTCLNLVVQGTDPPSVRSDNRSCYVDVPARASALDAFTALWKKLETTYSLDRLRLVDTPLEK